MATINDIVLIYLEESPLAFARVEAIEPDVKPDWYHIRLLLLQIPLQVVTWILRDIYINGETFTMDGKKMRLELVKAPQVTIPQEKETSDKDVKDEPHEKAKVISLVDMKKK